MNKINPYNDLKMFLNSGVDYPESYNFGSNQSLSEGKNENSLLWVAYREYWLNSNGLIFLLKF